jgi:L-rhamnose mutarotase
LPREIGHTHPLQSRASGKRGGAHRTASSPKKEIHAMKSFLRTFALSALLLSAFGCEKRSDTRLEDQDNAGKQPKRYCLTLDLKDDSALIAEYRFWHKSENIWPEIPAGIREVGITDMEIHLLGTRLFMIMEAGADFDFDKQMAKLAELPRQKEWEAFVSKYQKSSADAKSSEKRRMMERIFKLPEARK